MHNRIKKCNDELICFISLRKLNNKTVTFAWNKESVPIHIDYNTPELRKQWMFHQKQNFKEAMISISSMYGLSLSKDECIDYVERTFPKQ